MMVSAPQRVAHTILSTSSAIERGDRRVADVGVDLHRERLADDHRLALRVVVVGRDHRPAAGHLVAHQLGGHALARGDERHLRGDLAGPRPLQLGAAVAHDAGPRAGRPACRSITACGSVYGPDVSYRSRCSPLDRCTRRNGTGTRRVAVDLRAARDRAGGHRWIGIRQTLILHLPTPALPGQVRTVDGPSRPLSALGVRSRVWTVCRLAQSHACPPGIANCSRLVCIANICVLRRVARTWDT